jgi:hypothetical protein
MRARRPSADPSLRLGLRLRGGSALPAGMGKAYLECAWSRQVKRRAGRRPRSGGHPPLVGKSAHDKGSAPTRHAGGVQAAGAGEIGRGSARGSSGAVEEAGSQIQHRMEAREEMHVGPVVGKNGGGGCARSGQSTARLRHCRAEAI